MFKSMMLQARFMEYVEKNELEKKSEEENLRKYICYTYLSQIQPDRLDREFDLLDKICEDKLTNEGVIGVAITLNNQLLTTKTDIDDILQIEGKGKFDIYVFAYKDKITPERIVNDIVGGGKKNFEFAEIIQYMNSQKIITKWEELPSVNIIFLTEEEKEVEVIRKDSLIQIIYQVDEQKLLRIAQSNDNDCELVLEYTDGFPFPKENDEGQTYVVLCEADKLVDILTNEDGLI